MAPFIGVGFRLLIFHILVRTLINLRPELARGRLGPGMSVVQPNMHLSTSSLGHLRMR